MCNFSRRVRDLHACAKRMFRILLLPRQGLLGEKGTRSVGEGQGGFREHGSLPPSPQDTRFYSLSPRTRSRLGVRSRRGGGDRGENGPPAREVDTSSSLLARASASTHTQFMVDMLFEVFSTPGRIVSSTSRRSSVTQALGERCQQLTLNTFHFSSNVSISMGVPRLEDTQYGGENLLFPVQGSREVD